ncbi:MAG: patatin-like phospholipase family protein [Kosmotogaceae bacterium]|nr:patatin-like phospholipase family protein [Kosmotogaceae bacterium]
MKRALVLGGGGAKGVAHVGVIRALEEKGFVPDLIVGVSIGALVGAAYSILADSSSLWEITLRTYRKAARWLSLRKSIAGKDSPILSTIVCAYVNTFREVFPSRKYLRLLRKHLGRYRFSDTRIPFVCTSTIMNSAELCIHNDGSIYEALRASTAIPGLFKPEEKGGLTLADGGILNNLPVSVAREANSTFVVAVDLSSSNRVTSFNTSNSMLGVIDEYKAGLILQREIAAADVLISPVMTRNIDLLDLSSCIDVMNESYEETLKCDLNGVTL